MPSNRIDRPEHSFQSANLITEFDTFCAPDDPHSVTLVPDETHTCEEETLIVFVARGKLIHTDFKRDQVGYEHVFTSQQQARDHFEAAGLDQAILDAMIR